jgi:anaerobic ribonucleoside-triphosphate reductase activating protein
MVLESAHPLELRVAHVVASTQAEGPGTRFAVWVQGCSLRCPGCCNPELFTSKGGNRYSLGRLMSEFAMAGDVGDVEGVSILGGEPFEQPEALAPFVQAVQQAGKSVMIYTGYTLAELKAQNLEAVEHILRATDLLVDGRFEEAKKSTARRWIGSSNQQLHFLSSRYSPGEARFHSANTVELRWAKGQLTVNGWPSLADSVRPK